MYTKWTSHCTNEHEKAQFEADVRRAKPVLDRLQAILKQDLLMKEDEEESRRTFESPNWPYYHAYILGGKGRIKDIIKLIDLDKQKDNTNE